ncbi:SPOR domain-containing protein [Citreimonas salinaria]|uniref:Sporulation related domain-containing protein n=1 Tax=Citreimonas salinaria TaxID=321339 RepID=A0A1H3HYH2_9RHOB|nr:SPOR domain-containing protein [Citreimonas salinaria]SDY20285.1 Sporulation related domain-containing protein [Citreimonas salinaria]
MPFTSLRNLALIAAACGGIAAPAGAQQAFVAEPVNLPPADFTGDQFVDNDGCIFVRAGFDGKTTWVPRVTRSREPVCGQEPTFAAAAVPEPAEEPAVETVEAPSALAAVEAPKSPRAAAPATAASPAAQPAAAATPARSARPQASVPPRIVRSAPPRAPVAADARWDRPAPRIAPSAEVIPTAGGGTMVVAESSWIVPDQVFESRVERGVTIPPGYEPAWEDGRLNPWRAWQKVAGFRATQRVWTSTVPRIGIPEGVPATVEDPVAVYRTTAPAPRTGTGVRYVTDDGRRAVVSTSGAAAQPARFVRVGLFSSQGGADAAARRLHSAGLPVRFGTQRHDGRSLRAVLVGPFTSDAALRDGLAQTRRAGYADAVAH